MAKKIVDREKKRDWKRVNMFFEGIACVVVFLTILVDLISIFGVEKITQIASVISAILVLTCCFFNYKWVMKHFDNKPLLDDIFNSWTVIGILNYVTEKLIYNFVDYSKDVISRAIAIFIFSLLLICGIVCTVNISNKPEWKYKVDVDEG